MGNIFKLLTMAKKPWKIVTTTNKKKDIHSVLRRSDKVTFTIGDECKLKYVDVSIGNITRIWEEGDWWTACLKVAFGDLVMTLSGNDHDDIIIK